MTLSKRGSVGLAGGVLAMLLTVAAGCQKHDNPVNVPVKGESTSSPAAATPGSAESNPSTVAADSPWRLVLVDDDGHVLAPLPEQAPQCEFPPDAMARMGESDKPYLAVALADAAQPDAYRVRWPKDRVWKIAGRDGVRAATRLAHRVVLISEAHAGCHYLASENVAAGENAITTIGELRPAIAFAPEAKANEVRGAESLTPSDKTRWFMSEEETAKLLKQLAQTVAPAQVPPAYKGHWSQIAERPFHVGLVQARRAGKEERLALVVWMLPENEYVTNPFWLILRLSTQPVQVIEAPALSPDVNYFFAPVLLGAVDVDGGGNDELVVFQGYYEGSQYSVWALSGGKVKTLVDTPYFGL